MERPGMFGLFEKSCYLIFYKPIFAILLRRVGTTHALQYGLIRSSAFVIPG